MAVTQKASDMLDRQLQHMKEVEAGLIPADSPPTFIRADWKPNSKGAPGWFGPDWKPSEQAIDSAAKAQNEAANAAKSKTAGTTSDPTA